MSAANRERHLSDEVRLLHSENKQTAYLRGGGLLSPSRTDIVATVGAEPPIVLTRRLRGALGRQAFEVASVTTIHWLSLIVPSAKGVGVFVWIFHRISGVLLIFLIGFQLFTGFFQASSSNSQAVKAVAELHKHEINCLMVLLLVFHSLYGIRTILMDLGVKAEKLLFWVSTILGLILCAVFLVLYFTLVRP